LLTGAAFWAQPSIAADALNYGPAPEWVVSRPIPDSKLTEAPVAMLLQDQQTRFSAGSTITYTELAFRIQNPQGLAAGNLSVGWQPATDGVTINKIQIRRDGKVIDVIGAGQTFTVLRRETNLEAAMLDGTLTGNIQPEGLREGDIVDFAATTVRSDPVMKGHVEAMFGGWDGVPIESAHASLSWPANIALRFQQTANLPAPRKSSSKSWNFIEFSGRKVEPLIPPKGAPQRFTIGRLGEATDYRSWADVADLMIPLYEQASVIPSSGPLREELDRITSATADPVQRAERALALVQDRVRYVALLMEQGGYVPASAAETWSRRFGDCKAKTALLLGLLHELGIGAEPVLVNSNIGDAIGERLPMVGLFDHVLVRAHVGDKTYWLDGTRTGDSALASIRVPDFGWGLPLVGDAALVRIVPPPLERPDAERYVDIDASGGVLAPATITIREISRGDSAIQLDAIYSALSADQRDQLISQKAKGYFDGFDVGSSSIQLDKAKRELTVLIKGSAKLNWIKGWLFVPTSSIAFNPDFDRPPGPFQNVPIEVRHPRFPKDVASIKLPPGFAARQKLSASVRETLAGVEYVRKESVSGDVLTVESSERSLVAEIPYKTAVADAARLKALADDDVYLRLVDTYRPTKTDQVAILTGKPASTQDALMRAAVLIEQGKFDEAIDNANQALQLDPRNAAALATRALANAWNGRVAAAESDLKAAEKIDPDNPAALSARGLMAEKRGDCQAAIDAYSRAILSDPKSGFILGHRAICEHMLGKEDDALADSQQALESSNGWLDLRVLRANIFLSQNNPDAVANEADLLARENPESDYAWVAAGKTYARIGRHSKAMEAFDRALAIRPEAYVYLNRAQARPPDDHSGRANDLEAALKLEPDNIDAIAEAAKEYAAIGELKRSLALYDRLVNPSTGFSGYAVDRATVLHKAGRSAEASKILAAEEKKAKTATEFNNLCWAKATAGFMLESAVQDCRQALKIKPDSGAYLDSLGMALLKLGKLDEALAAYNQAVEKNTGAPSLMGRAIAYARNGDRAHADADAVAARKLYPKIDELFARYGLKF
jgi:tetratricopeptide (TPR) repeat protein